MLDKGQLLQKSGKFEVPCQEEVNEAVEQLLQSITYSLGKYTPIKRASHANLRGSKPPVEVPQSESDSSPSYTKS